MNTFITRKSEVRVIDSIKKIIISEGNHLVLGYGYISDSDLINDCFKMIIDKMKSNESLTIEIFIGLLCSRPSNYSSMTRDQVKSYYSDEYKKMSSSMLEMFNKYLPNSLYYSGVGERISLYAVPNFHAKFCLKANSSSLNCGLAGLMGSSNFTNSALSFNKRIELDLFMEGGADNEILQTFTETVSDIVKNAKKNSLSYVTDVTRDRLFEEPERLRLYELEIDDMIASFEEQEREDNLMSYMYSDCNDEDKEGLFESDQALEISYDTPENIKKYYHYK